MFTKKLEHKRSLSLEFQDSSQILFNENSQMKSNLEFQHLEFLSGQEKWERDKNEKIQQINLYQERFQQIWITRFIRSL
jgi:hypothetical protein